MTEIEDYTRYNEFKSSGLYTITNRKNGKVLNLEEERTMGAVITGAPESHRDNQKWQVADVGETKYLIINRQTGTYVRAIGNDGEPVEPKTGFPDHDDLHWRIVKPDANNPEITEFHSVKYKGALLDLKNGSDDAYIPVICHTQSSLRKGQKWLLKKIID